jgi:hypothetical protein
MAACGVYRFEEPVRGLSSVALHNQRKAASKFSAQDAAMHYIAFANNLMQ